MIFRVLPALLYWTLISSLAAFTIENLDKTQVSKNADSSYTVKALGVTSVSKLEITNDFAKGTVIELPYFCADGLNKISVSLKNGEKTFELYNGNLPLSQTWAALKLNPLPIAIQKGQHLTLKIENSLNKVSQFKALQKVNTESVTGALSWEEKVEVDRKIVKYLTRELSPIKIVKAGVEKLYFRIEGSKTPAGSRLIRLDLHEDPWDLDLKAKIVPVKLKNSEEDYTVSVPRFKNGRDFLYYRWGVINDSGDLIGTIKYATDLSDISLNNQPKYNHKSKKGLGGVHYRNAITDIDTLGIKHATVNMHIGSLIFTEKKLGTKPFAFNGKNYWYKPSRTHGWDKTLKYLTDRNVETSAIILIPKKHKLLAHPEAEKKGIFPMVNLTNEASADYYKACLYFLAKRYGRADRKYGLVTNWIMHNEISYAASWTNMGPQPRHIFLNAYTKSMRLANLISKQFNPHAQTFISLTHHWGIVENGVPRQCYPGKDLLDTTIAFTNRQGTYDWGVAHHPYPESLFEAKTWQDNPKKVTRNLDSPLITIKNIEVLDQYMHLKQALFEGKVRTLLLSEQGFNTRSYEEIHQKEAAAATAYMWKKIKPLKSVKAFHWHNWIDNKNEGGLKIGLRTFPTKENPDGTPKMSYHVYKDLDTPAEASRMQFAEKFIGIPMAEWSTHN